MKPLRQVAKEYRVTQSWISNIVNRTRRNPTLLRDQVAEVESA
jgi:Mor family transcriptional regulator